jgi:hypothetical protein
MSQIVYAVVSLIGGALAGVALGCLDVWFLSQRISFEQPHDYLSAAQLFVRYVPIAINGACGFFIGGLLALTWTTRAGKSQRRGFLSELLPWAVCGAFLGALVGYADIFALSQFLNLLNSDNAAAWRENRSYVAMINSAVGFVVGAAVGAAMKSRRHGRAAD